MMKLFRRSKPEPEPGLRALCYGKLPFAKDFLVSRGGDVGRHFQDWLSALDRGGRPAVLPRPVRVIYAPPSEPSYVVATIWDSADAGDVRKFPFALYFEVPRESGADEAPPPITTANPWWECLEHEYAALSAMESTETFFRELRKIRFIADEAAVSAETPAEGVARELGDHPLNTLIDGLFDADADAAWVSLLWRIERVLAVQEKTADGSHPIALRLPLTAALPRIVQTEAWLHAIRARIGDPAAIPSVIYPSPGPDGDEAEPGSFTLAFRRFRESDVVLLQETPGDADVLDLTQPADEADDAAPSAFVRTVSDLVNAGSPDLTRVIPVPSTGAAGESENTE